MKTDLEIRNLAEKYYEENIKVSRTKELKEHIIEDIARVMRWMRDKGS